VRRRLPTPGEPIFLDEIYRCLSVPGVGVVLDPSSLTARVRGQ
jgi:hypothetical protein